MKLFFFRSKFLHRKKEIPSLLDNPSSIVRNNITMITAKQAKGMKICMLETCELILVESSLKIPIPKFFEDCASSFPMKF